MTQNNIMPLRHILTINRELICVTITLLKRNIENQILIKSSTRICIWCTITKGTFSLTSLKLLGVRDACSIFCSLAGAGFSPAFLGFKKAAVYRSGISHRLEICLGVFVDNNTTCLFHLLLVPTSFASVSFRLHAAGEFICIKDTYKIEYL